jgi:uncharacterized protein YcbX
LEPQNLVLLTDFPKQFWASEFRASRQHSEANSGFKIWYSVATSLKPVLASESRLLIIFTIAAKKF